MLKINGYDISRKLSSVNGVDTYQAVSSSDASPVIVRHVKRYHFEHRLHQVQLLIQASNIVGLEKVKKCYKEDNGLIIVSENSGAVCLFDRIASTIGRVESTAFQLDEILYIACQLNLILGNLHAAGYVHKNITARSVLIQSDNKVILGGLEYCSASNDSKQVFLNVADLMGDSAYISPEQTGRMNSAIDYRADYYSMGMLIYEMLTGLLPCHSSNVMAAIYCHIALKAESPSKINPRVPPVFSSIVLKLLEKKPQDRYQSTFGIESDLSNCVAQLMQTGTIAHFPIGEDDFSEQLIFSDKIYGRESELNCLLEERAHAADGDKRVVYISGLSGAGKTGLISEFSQSVFEDEFLCVKGKFDQQNAYQPYSVFIQIFEDFIDAIESRTLDEQRYWKARIKSSLPFSVNVITDISSRLASFLDVSTKPEPLGLKETKNRFNASVLQFIRCICTKKSPVVMVLDDMHWADSASVELFTNLIEDVSIQYLLLVGIYRKNEISANLSAEQLLLGEFEGRDKPLNIELKNINVDEVLAILQDLLHQKSEDVTKLAYQLFDETQGNPYFVKQLLLDLRANHFFRFSQSKNLWVWQVIPELSQSKNVIDLIDVRLQKLTKETLNVLSFAAFLGSRFQHSTLKQIAMIDAASLDSILSQLVDENFLHYVGGEYRFSHDRVQQSVVDMLPHSQRDEIHYHIGTSLLASCSYKALGGQIYKITSHLNYALDLKKGDVEYFEKVRDLNVLAAKRANAEAAYAISNGFAQQAAQLLEEGIWETRPEIAFDIFFEQAKSEYLVGDIDQALKHLLVIVGHISTLEKQMLSFSLMKDIYTNQGLKYDDLLSFAIDSLQSSGEVISFDPSSLASYIKMTNDQIDEYFAVNSVSSILNLPKSSNKISEVKIQFYVELWEASYFSGRVDLMQFSILRIMSESLSSGNTAVSSFGYVLYASVLSNAGRYDLAFSFGKMAIELNRQFSSKILIPKINNLFCNYTRFHKKRFSESVALYYESIQVAQVTGDYLFGVWASYFYIWSLFLSGENLKRILAESKKHQVFVEQVNDKKMLQSYQMLQSFFHYYLDPESYDVKKDEVNFNHARSWQKDGFLPAPTWFSILSLQRLYLDEAFDKALKIVDEFAVVTNAEIVMFPMSQFHFYHALCLIAKAKVDGNMLSPENEKLVLESLEIIEDWEEYCPENFSYQKCLIKAEYAALTGQLIAVDYYVESIVAANLSDSDFIKALCNERRGKYLLESGYAAESVNAFEKSAYFYRQWGAVHRAKMLLEKYVNTSHADSKFIGGDSYDDFELNALVRASQAISSEINMDRLLMKMLSIALEHSYADSAFLFFVRDGRIYLAAENKEGRSHVYLDEERPLDSVDNVAKTVISQVFRHADDVILSDAKTHAKFKNDPYVKYAYSSSLMCCPIFIHGKMIAIIYLENTLLSDVFKRERLPYFHNLLSQLAISLENSQLYTGLETEIEERKKVEVALRKSELRMKLSQQFANVGTWEYNFIDQSLYWSDATKAIFGMPRSTQIEHIDSFNNIVFPDDLDLISKAVSVCVDTGVEYYVEHRVVLANGDIKWVSEAGDVQRDSDGNPIVMFGLVQDINARKAEESDRKKLEQQLQQAQKMESIGQLTGGIAHDFNNMLASILGFAQLSLASDVVDASPKLKGYLNQVVLAGNKAKDLVKQMLAFSRNEGSEKEIIDIGILLKEAMEMLSMALTSGVKFNIAIDDVDLTSRVNAVQVNQVVMNLCINARDAMSGSGELLINVDLVSLDGEQCSSCRQVFSGDFVRVVVQDSGEGMDAIVAERIFDPFFTTKEVGKGTGMGLSMVHGTVHDSGGHILLESIPAKGTSFSILFPAATINRHIIENKQINDESHSLVLTSDEQFKVLVVDDEISVATFLVELLGSKGILAECSHEPKKVSERLIQFPDEFDLVITDQVMPLMTGIELVKEVRKSNKRTQFILMTGFSETVNVRVAKEAGCTGFVNKPFDVEALLLLIDKVKKRQLL